MATQNMQNKQARKDANQANQTSLNGKTFTKKFSYKLSQKDEKSYSLTGVFDYTNCTDQQLFELATSHAIVIVQDTLRKQGIDFAKNLPDTMTFDIADILAKRAAAASTKRNPQLAAKIRVLDDLLAKGIITQAIYDEQRAVLETNISK